jgi:hypothetical protein
MSWKSISADDVLSYSGPASDLVESGPALYLWKRNFRPQALDLADSVLFMAWLRRVISAPVAELDGVRIAHFLTVRGISLSGELTETKDGYLSTLSKNEKGRKIIVEFLRDLAGQAPALYVGETDEVSRRLLEHLNGETLFGIQINESEHLSWSDLEFHYLELKTKDPDSSKSKNYRTALEQIAANVTIAGLTKRAG